MTAVVCVVVKSRVGRPPRQHVRITRSAPEATFPGRLSSRQSNSCSRVARPVTEHELWLQVRAATPRKARHLTR